MSILQMGTKIQLKKMKLILQEMEVTFLGVFNFGFQFLHFQSHEKESWNSSYYLQKVIMSK